MSSAAYDSRSSQGSRYDAYARGHDAYSMPATTMRSRPYDAYDAYSPYHIGIPRSPQPFARKHTWPPSPSVEDEMAPRSGTGEGEPPLNTRGTVDQESLLDEIAQDSQDRRFVLVSGPNSDDEASQRAGAVRDRRRKSVAEYGNMAPIETSLDPPVFTERVSTPYAYTRPQKGSRAPSPGAFVQSPHPIDSVKKSSDSQRVQNSRPPKSTSAHSRHNSFTGSRQTARDLVFDDSDLEPEDTTHLRTARKPARYSFVKGALQTEDLRTNLRDTQQRPEPRSHDSGQRPPPALRTGHSSGSAKDTPHAHSPRSSSPSLNMASRQSRPHSRAPSRPSSPPQRVPSPKLPSRLRDSPSSSRPASRGHSRPVSPALPTTLPRTSSSGHVPVTESDWHATYSPASAKDWSRPLSQYERHESMPIPAPRIDVKSPSPARPPPSGPSSLPYPIDDLPTQVFMPPEEHYQFDHSSIATSRLKHSDSPSSPSSSIPASPRLRDPALHPSGHKPMMPEEPTHNRRTRSSSLRSQSSQDGRREQSVNKSLLLDLDKPLPSCPRSTSSGRYDDWYSLKGCQSVDICPSCYGGVFAGTPFAVHFSQTRLYERPTERFCDFSSPWMRLAWLLTIKQRRQSIGLLYTLADIADRDRPCPGDREVGTDRVTWYGILDQRDGLHVANFAICSCDKNMIEALFPTMCGYFTKLSTNYQPPVPDRYLCSLRTSSRRFPRYLDLLVELDAEAQYLDQRPKINHFIQLARDNAFKGECGKDKILIRKPWHFIPSLPEFTVCEECYDLLVWPAIQTKSLSTSSAIPRLFNKTIQLVPGEDPDFGSSCCLYSPRMRRVWDASVKDESLGYLKRKALERKRAELRLARERKAIMSWMLGAERGSNQWERARSELKELEREWATWE